MSGIKAVQLGQNSLVFRAKRNAAGQTNRSFFRIQPIAVHYFKVDPCIFVH